jgi:hypothetical protein
MLRGRSSASGEAELGDADFGSAKFAVSGPGVEGDDTKFGDTAGESYCPAAGPNRAGGESAKGAGEAWNFGLGCADPVPTSIVTPVADTPLSITVEGTGEPVRVLDADPPAADSGGVEGE